MSDYALSDILENRKWSSNRKPFKHIHAQNVFTKPFYDELENQYKGWLEGKDGKSEFGGGSGWYQAQSYYVNNKTKGPFSIFASKPWHDMITSIFDFPFTNDVHIELHHHKKANGSGWLHNDLNPGWFAGEAKEGNINAVDTQVCEYRTGKCWSPDVTPRETIRAVSLLFYVANAPWKAGDGGETGLYLKRGTHVETPDRGVPPVNNSLLAFECTPYSYHSFVNNRNNPRNSMIMWFHRPKADVERRWGTNAIVNWTKS